MSVNVCLLYVALLLYLISTAFYFLVLVTNRLRFDKPAGWCLVFGFGVHLMSLIARYFAAGYTPITNIHESFSFLALCVACFYLYIKRAYPVRALGSIILPLICLLLFWALLSPSEIRPLAPSLQSWWLPVHATFSFFGNALFFIAFFVSLLYLLMEREIKKKKRLIVSERFPSLEVLDRINYRCISYGFPFLTVGIVTGSIWAGFAWGSYWSWDPKETWSLITWIVYAILIHNRLAIGWRGRRTAYMMILGFCSVLFTFLGVNFLIKGLHSYV
ncbi:MAG TPA: c-type cytochrome biogenesis protein CcsB [Syntrophorhabdaceae bacterium]|nr:c-type cytochrome biogenesis protein CcsB [Syntrophorhabdaceae bacterium]